MTEASVSAITFEEFLRVDIRIGTIIAAEPFPQARKAAYKLSIDFGPEIGVKRSSAQITTRYQAEDLLGRQVVAAINLPPRQIARFLSEVLVLGFPDAEGAVVLISADSAVPNGSRLY